MHAMAFQKKERPSNDDFKIDLLDRLFNLEILGDNNGLQRNTRYIMSRVFRYFPKREEYREVVINPLLDNELIVSYYDDRFKQWGPSFELTVRGYGFLDNLEVKFDNSLARQILRLIIQREIPSLDRREKISFGKIVRELRGKRRLIQEHLTSLIIRGIIDFDGDEYRLTASSYLIYKEVKISKTEEIVKSIEPVKKEQFENLLTQLLDEDD